MHNKVEENWVKTGVVFGTAGLDSFWGGLLVINKELFYYILYLEYIVKMRLIKFKNVPKIYLFIYLYNEITNIKKYK